MVGMMSLGPCGKQWRASAYYGGRTGSTRWGINYAEDQHKLGKVVNKIKANDSNGLLGDKWETGVCGETESSVV